MQLLLEAKADPNFVDSTGATILFSAVEHGQKMAVKLLLEASADPNLGRYTPLMCAARVGHHEIAKLLQKHGARDCAGEAERAALAMVREEDRASGCSSERIR